MNTGLNPDFSESGLDFKNPNLNSNLLVSGLNLDKSNQIPDQVRNPVPCPNDVVLKW